MNIRFHALLLLLTAGLLGLPAALHAQEDASALRILAKVTFKDGKQENADLTSKSFAVNTRFGKLGFSTEEVSEVRQGDNSYEWLLSTVHGDAWQIVIPFELLWQLPGTNTLEISRVAYSSPQQIHAREHGALMLELVDGSKVHATISPHAWELKQDDRSVRVAPANLAEAWIASADGKALLHARYPTGASIQGALPADTYPIKDLFGNKLNLKWKDIQRITPCNGLEIKNGSTKPANLGKENQLIRTRMYLEDDTLDVEIPVTHFMLNDELGEHVIPSAAISMIKPVSRGGVFGLGSGRFEVETVFGERWTGRLRPSRLSLADPDDPDESLEIRLRDCKAMHFKLPQVERPESIATIHLKGGKAFYAQLPPRVANIERALDMPESKLVSITPGSDGLWRIRLENRSVMAKATASTLSTRPLSTGIELEVSWSRIERIDFKPIKLERSEEDWKPAKKPVQLARLPDAPRTGGLRKPGPLDDKRPKPRLPPRIPDNLSIDRPDPDLPPRPRTRVEDEPDPEPEPDQPESEQPESVLVNGGTFMMGRGAGEGMDDEVPNHKVQVDGFHMDIHEVTRAAWEEFVEASGHITMQERNRKGIHWKNPGFAQEDDHPVVWVSWHDAVEYCNWRSKENDLDPCYKKDRKTNRYICDFEADGYRLPTEAEWEYAATGGGNGLRYPWGNSTAEATTQANHRQARDAVDDGWHWTNPAKAFPANKLGLHGLAGNAWEWCEDWYHPQAYQVIHPVKQRNPCVLFNDAPRLSTRVMRGGSFQNDLDFMRSASRGSGNPSASANRIGFRTVRRAHNDDE